MDFYEQPAENSYKDKQPRCCSKAAGRDYAREREERGLTNREEGGPNRGPVAGGDAGARRWKWRVLSVGPRRRHPLPRLRCFHGLRHPGRGFSRRGWRARSRRREMEETGHVGWTGTQGRWPVLMTGRVQGPLIGRFRAGSYSSLNALVTGVRGFGKLQEAVDRFSFFVRSLLFLFLLFIT